MIFAGRSSLLPEQMADVLLEIQNRGLSELTPTYWKRSEFLSEVMSLESSCFEWRAADSEKLGGFVLFRAVEDEAWVMNLAVAEKGCGYGRLMMLALFEALKTEPTHIKSVALEVGAQNTPAVKLYQSLDFEPIGLRKSYYSSGEDALVMRRCLQTVTQS